MAGLLIGEVARRAGVTPATIRYYESIRLLTPPQRSSAGYRRYSTATVEELTFIKKAQALGFSLEEIAEILRLTRSGQAPCSQVLVMARTHLTALNERIERLARFRDQLASELSKWDGQTAPTCQGLCQIIATAASRLADEAPPPDLTAHSLRPRGHRRRSRPSV